MGEDLCVLLPVAPVKLQNAYSLYGVTLETTHIDAEALRVGSRHIERFYAAMPAKIMPGNPGVEGINGKLRLPRQQSESIRRHNQVQVTRFLANTAVTLVRLDDGLRHDFELHGATMTAASVRNKPSGAIHSHYATAFCQTTIQLFAGIA